MNNQNRGPENQNRRTSEQPGSSWFEGLVASIANTVSFVLPENPIPPTEAAETPQNDPLTNILWERYSELAVKLEEKDKQARDLQRQVEELQQQNESLQAQLAEANRQMGFVFLPTMKESLEKCIKESTSWDGTGTVRIPNTELAEKFCELNGIPTVKYLNSASESRIITSVEKFVENEKEKSQNKQTIVFLPCTDLKMSMGEKGLLYFLRSLVDEYKITIVTDADTCVRGNIGSHYVWGIDENNQPAFIRDQSETTFR